MPAPVNEYTHLHLLVESEDIEKLDKIIPKGERSNVIRRLVKIFIKVLNEDSNNAFDDAEKVLKERLKK